ncbi:serine protease [Thelephora terrestris]|uniref:Serine protease n=1 Tax=Thelephora terrestris TaxID=56493 RepID=A0A9P6HI26_9AGAM|nr:serine protease [Thelephora terrestris]
MHSLSLFFGLLASITSSLAAPAPPSAPLYKYDGPVNQGGYIVKLVDGADKVSVLSLVGDIILGHDWDPKFFNGFAANLDEDAVNALLLSPNVEYVAENGIMAAFDVQTDASWNLARVSTRAKLSNQDPFALTYEYKYNCDPGEGIDIYVVDTGILVEHPDFEGRAKWGGAFCDGCAEADGNGHGTHVAGTAGGKRSGIAKNANLIAVKVLADDGSGTLAGVMDGLQWVYFQHLENGGRPSIATMSLGGSNAPTLDETVQQLIKAGIHCTVAAGNSAVDAKDTSPANTPEAITVGATDITDSMAWYSNYGSVVDVFAPGSNVTSTWNDGGYKTISGTSMATPAVAGLVAYLLNIFGKATTPATMSLLIQQLATKNALSNIPEGTANLLAFNGYWSLGSQP